MTGRAGPDRHPGGLRTGRHTVGRHPRCHARAGRDLIAAAAEVCPYAQAKRRNIEVHYEALDLTAAVEPAPKR